MKLLTLAFIIWMREIEVELQPQFEGRLALARHLWRWRGAFHLLWRKTLRNPLRYTPTMLGRLRNDYGGRKVGEV